MRHLFDRPLGTSVPNGVLLKRYDPSALIVAGAQMAGSFAQNQINAERAASDMATYLHLTKWNRQNQLRDQEWSKQFTYDLQRQQNLYDSPMEQMKRLQEAGLNPYLTMGGASGASPNVSKNAMSPSLPGSSSVSPFQRSPLDNPFPSSVGNLVAASSLKAQRIAADSQFAKALPDLVRGLGKDGAKRVASSVFGQDIDVQRMEDMIQNEYMQQQYDTKIKEVESQITSIYKPKEAANVIALQEQSFNKMAADIGYLASQGKLNEAKIKESASSYVRNLADAFKLKKEGDMYVASSAQYEAMSRLVSLQGDRLRFENKANGYVDGAPLWNYLGTKEHSKYVIGRYKNQDYLKGDAIGFWVDRFFNDYVKVLGSAAPAGGSSVTTTGYGY